MGTLKPLVPKHPHQEPLRGIYEARTPPRREGEGTSDAAGLESERRKEDPAENIILARECLWTLIHVQCAYQLLMYF